jgi:hypothetical protein
MSLAEWLLTTAVMMCRCCCCCCCAWQGTGLKLYTSYINNYGAALQELKKQQANATFRAWLEVGFMVMRFRFVCSGSFDWSGTLTLAWPHDRDIRSKRKPSIWSS